MRAGRLPSRDELDAMSLGTLCLLFDNKCNEAREKGQWLYEYSPEFSAYCMERIPALVRLGSGCARKKP